MIIDSSTLAAFRETTAWLMRRRRRVRVTGESMLPTLKPDDQVLVDPLRLPRVGDLVVAHHPQSPDQFVVKRLVEITGDGSLVVASDNAAQGTDSRTWGPLDAASLVGAVTWVFDRPEALVKPGRRPPLSR